MRTVGYILGFVLLLIAPIGAHWMYRSSSAWAPVSSNGVAASDRLVIITPNNEDIRNEFAWAFSDWHRQTYGQPVELQFLSPGGTSDIKRQLELTYRQIRAGNHDALPAEDQINTGIQLVWGGGDTFFDRELKPLGIFRAIDLNPAQLEEIFPQPSLAGVKLYDQDHDPAGQALAPKWVGTCLSSFGVIYNPDLYAAMNLSPPKTWTDLADPRLAGSVSLADPTHSGTAALMSELVLQRTMADAEGEFFEQPRNRSIPHPELLASADYQLALDAGWKRGMGQLEMIAANARFFSDDARQPPTDVASGDAAAGTAIDFYAKVTQQSVGPQRLRFVVPAAATAVTPDPIAILYGTHGRQLELANHFVQFVLSQRGQRLWILNPGQSGGPRIRPLWRAPIRRDVYADQTGWTDDANYFTQANGFVLHQEWLATFSDIRMIWAAAWIDCRDQLRETYGNILAVEDPSKRRRLLDELADIPVTRGDVAKLMAQRIKIEHDPNQDADQWKAMQRIDWAQRFREHYRAIYQKAIGS